MTRHRLRHALVAVCVLYCTVLVADLTPLARGHLLFLPETQYFPWLRLSPRFSWLLVNVALVSVYAFGAWHLVQHGKALYLKLWAFSSAAILPIALMGMEGAPLFTLFARVASPDLGGYITAAAISGDPSTMLHDWLNFLERYQASYPIGGIALAPPALPMLFHIIAAVFERIPLFTESLATLLRSLQCQNPDLLTWSDAQLASALPAMLMPLWTGLAIAPLYRLGVRLFGCQTALWAVALYPLVPSLAIFAPRFNTFYALLCVVMLVFVWAGLLKQRLLLLGLGGFVAGMGSFMNFAAVPLSLIGALSVVLWWWRTQRKQLRQLIVSLASFGAGAASIWLVYTALTGITPFDILHASFSRHLALDRPYLIYLVYHPLEMFLFTGIPVAATCLWRIGTYAQLNNKAYVFVLSVALSLLMVTLSGTARGETARVWAFFAPIWVLLAADGLASASLRTRQIVLGLQVLVFLSMGSSFRANFHILTPVPDPPTPVVPPSTPMQATFTHGGDVIQLLGWRAESNSQGVVLHFYWQVPERPVRALYQFALVPLAPDGTTRPSLNWMPYERNFPPSCWTPRKVIVDSIDVPLTAADPYGDWWFSLSVIHVQTRTPISVNGTERQVGIGAVRIPF
ncbi:MAG: hypothetical protein NZ571_15850 [Anaerolineae bacterium]|nr:hypothetical protein [Anaerolineae bacterium]